MTHGSCGCSTTGRAPTRGRPDSIVAIPPEPLPGGGGVPCEAFPFGAVRTNDNFVFLREILQGDGSPVDPVDAGNCLVQWLQNTALGSAQPDGQQNDPVGAALGVLVIDQLVVLQTAIAIPVGMTLSGVGIHGAGVLRFEGLGAVAAITFLQPATLLPSPSFSSIQDLVIEHDGLNANASGIWVGDLGDLVYLRRLSMRNWGAAIVNSAGFSVIVEQCLFEDNSVHIDLNTIDPPAGSLLPFAAATATRIRECAFFGASGPAVRLNSPGVAIAPTFDVPNPSTVNGNSCLITGCSFSGNQYGVVVDRHQAATIIGNSFVGDAVAGVYVTSNAREARVIANYFDLGDRLVFEELDIAVQVRVQHHQWGLNTVADEVQPQLLADYERLVVEAVYVGSPVVILPP